MKFIGLLGSPNPAGRTRLVADAIATGIAAANGQVEMISLAGEPPAEVVEACRRGPGTGRVRPAAARWSMSFPR